MPRAGTRQFAFVDVKHCHGYLGHEFLSAVDRPGRYGGSLDNRTRFLRETVAGIRAEAPGLEIGVRVSVYDFVPYRPGPDGTGVPMPTALPYRYAFGGDGSGIGIDLRESSAFLEVVEKLGIELVCISAGSPITIRTCSGWRRFRRRTVICRPKTRWSASPGKSTRRRLKRLHPRLLTVGSGYSYLQEWLPHVGQKVVREGMADFIGLGRMVLAYPELPADVLAGRPLARKRICRTFSECTTAPRNGMISGCYPLDPFYKERPERALLQVLKEKNAKP